MSLPLTCSLTIWTDVPGVSWRAATAIALPADGFHSQVHVEICPARRLVKSLQIKQTAFSTDRNLLAY